MPQDVLADFLPVVRIAAVGTLALRILEPGVTVGTRDRQIPIHSTGCEDVLARDNVVNAIVGIIIDDNELAEGMGRSDQGGVVANRGKVL